MDDIQVVADLPDHFFFVFFCKFKRFHECLMCRCIFWKSVWMKCSGNFVQFFGWKSHKLFYNKMSKIGHVKSNNYFEKGCSLTNYQLVFKTSKPFINRIKNCTFFFLLLLFIFVQCLCAVTSSELEELFFPSCLFNTLVNCWSAELNYIQSPMNNE